MSYYKYLNKYSPGFLKKYQTETYSHLSRSTRFAEIVNMNATSTLSIDEDLSLGLSVPFNLTNFLGFLSLVYWYFYHIDMSAANTIKNRLRSYHNYKMWSRLEVMVRKCNVEYGEQYKKVLEEQWFEQKNITREQYAELLTRVANGEQTDDVIASMSKRFNPDNDRLDDI